MGSNVNDEKFDGLFRLFSDDERWILSRTDQTAQSTVVLEERLKGQITANLSGQEIDSEVFKRVQTQLEYDNYLSSDKLMHCHVLNFLHLLNHFGIRPNSYTDDQSRWMKAKTEFEKLLSLTSCQERYTTSESVSVKGDAIRQLRDLGYKIPITRGVIRQAPEDVGKFIDSMRYHFERLGGVSLPIVLHHIESVFSDTMGRYMFHRPLGMFARPTLYIPWGYLFAVALSYWPQERKLTEKKAVAVFDKICNVATLFMSTFEVQPLTGVEEMLRSPTTSLSELQEVIMYEQHFGLDQVRPDYMLTILRGLVSHCEHNRMADLYLLILEWVCKQESREMPRSFTVDLLMQELGDKSFSRDEVGEALESLSQSAESVNVGCMNPYKVSRNYFKRPFIRRGDQLYLIAPMFFAKGFYYVWKERLYNKKENLGKMFEHCVAEEFKEHGVEFRSNVKFAVSGEKRSILMGRKEGECDFIIETEKTIYFVEMKSKEITAKAMSGDPRSALTDMASSALYGWLQAVTAEYCLRADGRLEFDDGSVLELNQRRIEKIHLSPFDHYGLYDNLLVRRYLRAMLSLDYSCDDATEDWKNFKDYQLKFRKVISSEIIRTAYTPNKALLTTFHSYSLPQFLTMLESVKTTDEFVSEMSSTMSMTTMSKDWYYDHAYAKRVLKV